MEETEQLLSGGILGLTAGTIPLTCRRDFAQATLEILRQTQREVQIYTPDLEAALYDREEVIAELRRILLRRRERSVHIVVEKIATARSYDHRIIPLLHQFSDRIALRRPLPEQENRPFGFLIADLDGYIYRRHPDNYQGEADFHQRSRANQLSRQFSEIWERAEPERGVRQLYL